MAGGLLFQLKNRRSHLMVVVQPLIFLTKNPPKAGRNLLLLLLLPLHRLLLLRFDPLRVEGSPLIVAFPPPTPLPALSSSSFPLLRWVGVGFFRPLNWIVASSSLSSLFVVIIDDVWGDGREGGGGVPGGA